MVSARKTQNRQVLEHLEKEPITSMQAFNDYGITRLSGRIYDLRNMGYRIETETVKGISRTGLKTKYARYRLVEDK